MSKRFLRQIGAGVIKSLIVDGIKWLIVVAVPIALGVLWVTAQPVRDWTSADVRVRRGVVVLFALTLLGATAWIVGLLIARHRERTRRSAEVAPPGTMVPARFDPELFALTPPRRRALLALLHRVDAKTTLHQLYEAVVNDGPLADAHTSKAQVQQDMDAAERAGIVSIDRVSSYAQYFKLTVPAGRDWVLSKQAELNAGCREGMFKRDRPARFF